MNRFIFHKESFFTNVFFKAQFHSKIRRRDEIARLKLALHSEFMVLFGLDPWVQIQCRSDPSIHLRARKFSVSDTPNDTPTRQK